MRIWEVEVYYQWTEDDPWELWDSWNVNAETIQEATDKALKAEQERWAEDKKKPKKFEIQKATLLNEVDVE